MTPDSANVKSEPVENGNIENVAENIHGYEKPDRHPIDSRFFDILSNCRKRSTKKSMQKGLFHTVYNRQPAPQNELQMHDGCKVFVFGKLIGARDGGYEQGEK